MVFLLQWRCKEMICWLYEFFFLSLLFSCMLTFHFSVFLVPLLFSIFCWVEKFWLLLPVIDVFLVIHGCLFSVFYVLMNVWFSFSCMFAFLMFFILFFAATGIMFQDITTLLLSVVASKKNNKEKNVVVAVLFLA